MDCRSIRGITGPAPDAALEIRAQGRGRAVHARLPAALAELQSGFELWLEFAVEQGAISIAERAEWRQRSEHAFEELAILLEPTVSYPVAQALAGSEPLPVSQQILHRRLRESGLVASVDPSRQMVQIRRMLEGYSRQVLHLKAADLMRPSDDSDR